MSATTPNLGDKLAQMVAERLAAQSERRQGLHSAATALLEKFLDRRAESQEKLAAKLDSIHLKPKPEKGFRLFWRSHQKRVNQELRRTNEQLADLLRQMLKEQKSETRDVAKVLRTMLDQMDERPRDNDPS